MSDEQNEPVRSRDEQIEDLASQIFFGARNHTDGMFEAKRHIEEAEARGAAEQRRKDGEGQEPVYQVYRGDYYGWFDCKKSEWEEDDRDPEHKRVLYTHPANVAALEGRIAELEKERDQYREGHQEMEALRKFYATNERHLKVVALARDVLASDGTPS